MTPEEFFSHQRERVDAALESAVPAADTQPPVVHQAMRHSLFAGGKRIRPLLALGTAMAISGEANGAVVRCACALELVHTYSLIHDDLPALDNDDFRRGKPTCHKVYGEAMAILAGDALLTRAFQLLATEGAIPADRRIAIIAELSTAAGTVDGMIGGQVADLEAEGQAISADELRYIHRSKTGALIGAAVQIGALAAGATDAQLAALEAYGRHAGIAFQIVDDILDVTATTAQLGKTAGKDVAQDKATYPALFGLEASREHAAEHHAQALDALETFGDNARPLRWIAERIVHRTT